MNTYIPSVESLVTELQITQNRLLTAKSMRRLHKANVRQSDRTINEYQKQLKYITKQLQALSR